MIDRQAIFDRVRKHFLADRNLPGWDANRKRCTYANPPCAIGIFDAQGVLADRIDAVTGIPKPILKDIFPDFEARSPVLHHDSDLYFLLRLQRAHDSACGHYGEGYSEFHSNLEAHLRHFARDFNLEWKDTL